MAIANRDIYIAICNIRQEGIFEAAFGTSNDNCKNNDNCNGGLGNGLGREAGLSAPLRFGRNDIG
jgi:hypothetical protein